MAAPKENSLSLGFGIGMERNIFIKQRERRQNNSTTVLQHLEELKKRELAAKLHNEQLLHQFEEAQDTLRSMLTLTASMRTIRMEYERYLEYERYPLWQHQPWERTQAAQRKRMEEQIKSSQKNTSDEVAKASADQLLTSQACYNQDHSSSLLNTQSAWLSRLHSQSRCPVSAPLQPSQLHHLATLTEQNDHTRRRQSAPDQASVQSDPPRSWVAGIPSCSDALRELLNVEDGHAERQALQAETSGASSSKTERSGRGSCSSHLSQELDDKPVRLSDIPAESSSESSGVSNGKRRKKEKGGSSWHSSNRKGNSSQDSSQTSSVTIAAVPCKVSQKSDDSISSEEGISTSTRRRKKGGHATEVERTNRTLKDKNMEEDEGEEEGQTKSNKDESSKEESGSQEEKPKSGSEIFKNVGGDLSSSSEEVSGEEQEAEEEQQKPTETEKVEDSDSVVNEDSREEAQEKPDTEDVPERQNSTDGEEMRAEEEMEEQESDEEGNQVEQSERLTDDEKGSRPPTSPQREKGDEGLSYGGEDKVEEEEEDQEGESSEEAAEQNGGESGQAEEESDSDDSIISPQSRTRELHNVPEDKEEYDEDEDEDDDDDDEEEEEDGTTSGKSEESSEDDDNEDDDIEHLLAPQEQTEEKLEENEEKESTKALCKVQSFQVKMVDAAKTDELCDSDEYDNFYD